MERERDKQLDWRAEATAVISDVKAHVKSIEVSSLHSPDEGIYLNIITMEGSPFCVLMGPSGFRVVSNVINEISLQDADEACYETPYALLSAISPAYDQSFGNLLMKKLTELVDKTKT